MSRKFLDTNQKLWVCVQREVRILKILNVLQSKYFVRLFDCFFDDDFVYLVLDYIPEGNLKGLIEKRVALSETEAQNVIKQIVSGVKVLHEMEIIHRDLKPENIFIATSKPNLRVVLGDFGLSRFLKEHKSKEYYTQSIFFKSETQVSEFKLSTQCVQQDTVRNTDSANPELTPAGSINYMAPELLQQHVLPKSAVPLPCSEDSLRVDMFSLGVTSYYLLAGKLPFAGSLPGNVLSQMQLGIYERIPNISSNAQDFCDKLFRRHERSTIWECYTHSWLLESEFCDFGVESLQPNQKVNVTQNNPIRSRTLKFPRPPSLQPSKMSI